MIEETVKASEAASSKGLGPGFFWGVDLIQISQWQMLLFDKKKIFLNYDSLR